MKRIVVKSKVSSDAILHLSVPVGLEEAAGFSPSFDTLRQRDDFRRLMQELGEKKP